MDGSDLIGIDCSVLGFHPVRNAPRVTKVSLESNGKVRLESAASDDSSSADGGRSNATNGSARQSREWPGHTLGTVGQEIIYVPSSKLSLGSLEYLLERCDLEKTREKVRQALTIRHQGYRRIPVKSYTEDDTALNTVALLPADALSPVVTPRYNPGDVSTPDSAAGCELTVKRRRKVNEDGHTGISTPHSGHTSFPDISMKDTFTTTVNASSVQPSTSVEPTGLNNGHFPTETKRQHCDGGSFLAMALNNNNSKPASTVLKQAYASHDPAASPGGIPSPILARVYTPVRRYGDQKDAASLSCWLRTSKGQGRLLMINPLLEGTLDNVLRRNLRDQGSAAAGSATPVSPSNDDQARQIDQSQALLHVRKNRGKSCPLHKEGRQHDTLLNQNKVHRETDETAVASEQESHNLNLTEPTNPGGDGLAMRRDDTMPTQGDVEDTPHGKEQESTAFGWNWDKNEPLSLPGLCSCPGFDGKHLWEEALKVHESECTGLGEDNADCLTFSSVDWEAVRKDHNFTSFGSMQGFMPDAVHCSVCGGLTYLPFSFIEIPFTRDVCSMQDLVRRVPFPAACDLFCGDLRITTTLVARCKLHEWLLLLMLRSAGLATSALNVYSICTASVYPMHRPGQIPTSDLEISKQCMPGRCRRHNLALRSKPIGYIASTPTKLVPSHQRRPYCMQRIPSNQWSISDSSVAEDFVTASGMTLAEFEQLCWHNHEQKIQGNAGEKRTES